MRGLTRPMNPVKRILEMIDVKTAKTSELVAYYNAHLPEGAKSIKKFVDRKTAEQRVLALAPPKADKNKTSKSRVTVDGEEYRSVAQAFEKLKLPMGRHIKFRMKLKVAGKLAFEHDAKSYKFAIVA
jgi:hypothetical protein